MKTNYVAFVAVDWGDQNHAFVLETAEGRRERGVFEATAESVHGWLDKLEERLGGGAVALALEAGKSGFLHALLSRRWLTVYPIHTAASEHWRKTFVASGAKDDLPDAEVLLELLTHHRKVLRAFTVDAELTRRLGALVEIRRRLVNERTNLTQELISDLKLYFPQAIELIGQNHTAPLALDLLARWPELAALQQARAATVRAFYFAHNVRRPGVIDARLELIRTARPLLTDRAVIEPAILHVQAVVALLRPLNKHIDVVEAEIECAFNAHPDAAIFRSLPGAGPAFAPRLLAAFGSDRSRYRDPTELQKHAGIAPVRERSGRQVWTHWRWNAPCFLRQSFVEWAGETVVHCAWAKAYYFQQKRAGKRHQAILRALAFKWIRIIWRCWQDHVPYDDARYAAALRKRNSPLALALAA
jgi:transposase